MPWRVFEDVAKGRLRRGRASELRAKNDFSRLLNEYGMFLSSFVHIVAIANTLSFKVNQLFSV